MLLDPLVFLELFQAPSVEHLDFLLGQGVLFLLAFYTWFSPNDDGVQVPIHRGISVRTRDIQLCEQLLADFVNRLHD